MSNLAASMDLLCEIGGGIDGGTRCRMREWLKRRNPANTVERSFARNASAALAAASDDVTIPMEKRNSYWQASLALVRWARRPIRITWANANSEVREAIALFAKEHGRNWRTNLRNLWMLGGDTGGLRQARNFFGPKGLDNITAEDLGE